MFGEQIKPLEPQDKSDRQNEGRRRELRGWMRAQQKRRGEERSEEERRGEERWDVHDLENEKIG